MRDVAGVAVGYGSGSGISVCVWWWEGSVMGCGVGCVTGCVAGWVGGWRERRCVCDLGGGVCVIWAAVCVCDSGRRAVSPPILPEPA